jgi:hypothetical protein
MRITKWLNDFLQTTKGAEITIQEIKYGCHIHI